MNKVLVGSPEYFRGMGGDSNSLLYLTLNHNTHCSYKCVKCALACGAQKGESLTNDERRAVIRRAAAAGAKALVVIGDGEPTENRDVMMSSIEEASKNGMITILFSTLNGLNQAQADFFRDHQVTVIVSLDSLEVAKYRYLTGVGTLPKILRNFEILRKTLPVAIAGDSKFVRMGVNTTVVNLNVDELSEIRKFCGDDVQYVANPPMRQGRINGAVWDELVGDNFDWLEREARRYSETGGHSSLTEGVCGYFHRGVSVDTDGDLLTCGYAGDSRSILGNVRDKPDFLEVYERVRGAYEALPDEFKTSCPVRGGLPQLIDQLKR